MMRIMRKLDRASRNQNSTKRKKFSKAPCFFYAAFISRRLHPRARRIATFLLVFTGLVSCETRIAANASRTDELVIHGLLVSDAEEQRLLLTRVLKNISDPLPPVADAIVEVNGVRFSAITMDRSSQNAPYNWIASGLNLESGKLCSLWVFYQNRVIRGQTMMPKLGPVTVKGDTIFWPGEFAPYKYAVWLNDLHFTAIRKLPFVVRENYSLPLSPGRYRLRVLPYDDNYALAQESRENAIGLEGAYGLFASACAWEDSVDLK